MERGAGLAGCEEARDGGAAVREELPFLTSLAHEAASLAATEPFRAERDEGRLKAARLHAGSPARLGALRRPSVLCVAEPEPTPEPLPGDLPGLKELVARRRQQLAEEQHELERRRLRWSVAEADLAYLLRAMGGAHLP